MDGNGSKMFTVIFVFFYIFNVCIISADKWFGPYKTILKDTKQCDSTERIINETEKILHLYHKVTNDGRTLLQGNVTVRDLKQIKMTISAYQLNHKKFTAKNINCHNTLGEIIYTAIRLPVKKRGCYVRPGTYYFSDIDINKSIHKFIQAVHYGPFELKIEVFIDNRNERKEIDCVVIVGENEPTE